MKRAAAVKPLQVPLIMHLANQERLTHMPLSNYQPTRIGHAAVDPADPLIAGELSEFELIYTAGL